MFCTFGPPWFLIWPDVTFSTGARVQPICLPLPNANILPQTACMTAGWGRIKERMSFFWLLNIVKLDWSFLIYSNLCNCFLGGHLPMVLREVHLDLVDRAKCKYVLQTLKGSMMNQRLVRPQPSMTVLCAGPETGGRDACQVLKIFSLSITSDFFLHPHRCSIYSTIQCRKSVILSHWALNNWLIPWPTTSSSVQGDSGGPLVCPAGSEGHRWVALGVTSWGKGCGRSWGNNSSRPPSKRGSPGIFTDVRLLLPWIKRKLREGRFWYSIYSIFASKECDRHGVSHDNHIWR